VSLHTDFGISLGNKLFRNVEFEKRIADVQKRIEEMKTQGVVSDEASPEREPQSPTKARICGQDVDEEKVDAFY